MKNKHLFLAVMVANCQRKHTYSSKSSALEKLEGWRNRIETKGQPFDDTYLHPYQCPICFQWHLGRRNKGSPFFQKQIENWAKQRISKYENGEITGKPMARKRSEHPPRDELIQLYQKLRTKTALAKYYGKSATTIHNWFKWLEIPDIKESDDYTHYN